MLIQTNQTRLYIILRGWDHFKYFNTGLTEKCKFFLYVYVKLQEQFFYHPALQNPTNLAPDKAMNESNE